MEEGQDVTQGQKDEIEILEESSEDESDHDSVEEISNPDCETVDDSADQDYPENVAMTGKYIPASQIFE